MYVLDRLLALQLGRPFAIHEADYHVQVPSRDERIAFDAAINLSSSQMLGFQEERENSNENDIVDVQLAESYEKTSIMDYFICVIQFSHILGRVVQKLYPPTQVDSSLENLLLASSFLDSELSSWKFDLPYHLRFDLGHTFEKSVTFKRQVSGQPEQLFQLRTTTHNQKRNMLAVKVHHLRALIHRPFLCLPWLRRGDPAIMDVLQKNRSEIDRAEKICVFEAQQTARLLHHVENEEFGPRFSMVANDIVPPLCELHITYCRRFS